MLVNLANARGGSDNCTAVVAAAGPLPKEYAATPVYDPTKPPNPLLLIATWMIAGVFLIGVSLLLLRHYVEGVLTTGLSLAALAAALFRLWQRWYHRPREKPLHGAETVHWRPYRTATAGLSDAFLKQLARIEADLRKAAVEEGWPVRLERPDKLATDARSAAQGGRTAMALSHWAEAIDLLMRAMSRHRRPEVDPLPDLVPDRREPATG